MCGVWCGCCRAGNARSWRCVRVSIGWLIAALAFAGACEGAPLLVMPVGDSNTVGTANGPGSYRTRLWQNFGSDPTRISFTGTQESGPFELANKAHEGHNGFTIAAAPVGSGNITDNIANYFGARRNPDLVLLMLGTNDMNLNFEVEQAPAKLDFLIGRILQLRPAVKVLVASVPPIDDARNQFRTGNDFLANSRVQAFNAAIPGLVAARQASGQNVHFVDVNKALTIADIDDGLHPTRAGFDKIGDTFYRAIVGVPEPASAALLAVGGAMLGGVRRRPARRGGARRG